MQREPTSTLRWPMWVGLALSFILAFYFTTSQVAYDHSYLRSAPYFLLFFALFDSPHFFLTFLRTHQDPEEFKRHKWHHTLGLLFIVLLTGYLFTHQSENYMEFIQWLGSFHIYRQNVGFQKLAMRQQLIDEKTFKTEQYYYFAIMAFAWTFPHYRVLFPQFELLSLPLSLIVNFIFVLVMFLSFKVKAREDNIYMTLTQIVTFWAFYDAFNPSIGTIIETVYHDIQYIFFIIAFQSLRKFPLRNFYLALGAGGIFGFLSEGSLLPPEMRKWISAFVIGILVYHYVIDAFIWRFSTSAELAPLKKIAVFVSSK